MMSAAESIRALAQRVQRLRIDWRDQEPFYLTKDLIAADLRRIARRLDLDARAGEEQT
jgi:hypothetical protein